MVACASVYTRRAYRGVISRRALAARVVGCYSVVKVHASLYALTVQYLLGAVDLYTPGSLCVLFLVIGSGLLWISVSLSLIIYYHNLCYLSSTFFNFE